ncbi:MAG: L-rhamnose mutarotase [Cytophagales bacterium]|nr:L-rhamnose mutarotase [Cytophagales bacterium]
MRPEEYQRRHDARPELGAITKETGIEDYSIFLDEETNFLFGVLKAKNPELMDKLARASSNEKMVELHEGYYGLLILITHP